MGAGEDDWSSRTPTVWNTLEQDPDRGCACGLMLSVCLTHTALTPQGEKIVTPISSAPICISKCHRVFEKCFFVAY